MSSPEHTHDTNDQRRGRVAEFLTKLGLGPKKEKAAAETERSREPLHYTFTLKVDGETQIATMEIAPRTLQIDEELLHPEPGLVAVVTRPSKGVEPLSNVFRIGIGDDGGANWVCDAVKGDQVRRLPSPMSDLLLAQSPDEKSQGQFAPVTLHQGAAILVTRRAEIADIQAAVEASQADPEALRLQEKYQAIIDLATSIPIEAESGSGTIANRVAEIDALLAEIEVRTKETAELVVGAELSEKRGEDGHDLLEAARHRLLKERARLTGEQ